MITHNIQVQLKQLHHDKFILLLILLLFINYTYFNKFGIINFLYSIDKYVNLFSNIILLTKIIIKKRKKKKRKKFLEKSLKRENVRKKERKY